MVSRYRLPWVLPPQDYNISVTFNIPITNKVKQFLRFFSTPSPHVTYAQVKHAKGTPLPPGYAMQNITTCENSLKIAHFEACTLTKNLARVKRCTLHTPLQTNYLYHEA